MASGQEFKAQGEGCIALDLFRELDRAIGSERLVALPSLNGLFGLHAAPELALSHQVESQSLHRAVRWVVIRIVWTLYIQIITQIDLDRVIISC